MKNFIYILLSYIFLSVSLSINHYSIFKNYICIPFWLFTLLYLLFYIKCNYVRINHIKLHLIYILELSFLFIIIYFNSGMILGFFKPPFNHSIIGIIKNIFIFVIPVIAEELLRTLLIIKAKDRKQQLIFITIIFILVEINYHTIFISFMNRESLFKFLCSSIFPIISSNILFTYISYKLKEPLAMVFKIIDKLIIIIVPVIPVLDWFVIGSSSLLKLFIIYIIIKYKIIKDEKPKKKKTYVTMLNYAIPITVCLILVCFMIGLFSYQPIAILSNSMIPTFERGDIVIFKKFNELSEKEIHEGDIVIYNYKNMNVAHRIKKIHIKNNQNYYITKGDNNKNNDLEEVSEKQIIGIYKFHIKYIGYPTVWLNDYFMNKEVNIDAK